MEPVCLPEKYEILGTLGSGGMGTVWRARDRTLQREVALKVMSEKVAEDPKFVQRFQTEARAAASLNHPSIVQIYEFGQTGRGHFLAMELVDGPSLRTELRQRGRFSEAETISLAREVCAALAVAHAAGIVHRDIKPDNLMFTRTRQFKLVDLGLAKKLTDEVSNTMTGQSLGTPHFISPEQIMGSAEVDARADIYSLGATMYYLATGAVPYDGTSAAHIMSRHLNDPLPDPRRSVPGLNSDFCRVMGRMMAKDPADRYQNVVSVDSDLQTIQRGGSLGAFPPVATDIQQTIFISSPDLEADQSVMTLDEAEVERLSKALARYIGPLAQVLVNTTRKKCTSWASLVEELSLHIANPTDRRAFKAKSERLAKGEQTTHMSSPSLTDPGATMAMPGTGGASMLRGVTLADEKAARIVQLLADQIGPVARVLVKREAAKAHDMADLTERLASNLQDDKSRSEFRRVMQHMD